MALRSASVRAQHSPEQRRRMGAPGDNDAEPEPSPSPSDASGSGGVGVGKVGAGLSPQRRTAAAAESVAATTAVGAGDDGATPRTTERKTPEEVGVSPTRRGTQVGAAPPAHGAGATAEAAAAVTTAPRAAVRQPVDPTRFARLAERTMASRRAVAAHAPAVARVGAQKFPLLSRHGVPLGPTPFHVEYRARLLRELQEFESACQLAEPTWTGPAPGDLSSYQGGGRSGDVRLQQKPIEPLEERRQEQWLAHYEKLRAYKTLNGNCNVPRDGTNHSYHKLARWCCTQRVEYRRFIGKKPKAIWWGKEQNPKITQERIDLLNAIGFEWEPKLTGNVDDSNRRAKWEKFFAELKAYKDEHGHTGAIVGNRRLANWAKRQRAEYKLFKEGRPIKGNRPPGITQERIDTLNAIGFEWVATGGAACTSVRSGRFSRSPAAADHSNCAVTE